LGRPRTRRTFTADRAGTCDACDNPIKAGDPVALESGYLVHAACTENPDSLDDDAGLTDDDD
jgi:hypothetical protein